MTPKDSHPTILADMQAAPDVRNIPIDRVGVRGVKYPMHVRGRDGEMQHTVGHFTLTVDLPKEFKGTHMSRFVEVLSEHNHDLSVETIPAVLEKLRRRLSAKTAHLEVTFLLFMEKAAPVTGKTGMMGFECGFLATGGATNELQLELVVPVTTLCPCSKEIADRGAHNQRGYVRLKLTPDRSRETLWLEDLIETVEAAGSAPLYPLLKRPDEKYVTELAYDNPRFVEDMVREVALALDADRRVLSYEIEVENHESIHDHNSYAYLKRERAG
ncbi:MAG TPA: GTP cyclohydrolase FolE2 [Fimbriimonadaceae bacterium]|nr:GTP cyclohydrolase FolE2 [Fimbriimonadaceae bacterium]